MEHAMSVILAIDLGKFNTVFGELNTATGEAEFRTIATSPTALRAELVRQPASPARSRAADDPEEVFGTAAAFGPDEPSAAIRIVPMRLRV
jgi:hypothetical protein